MKFDRFIKTIFLTEFISAMGLAIKEIFKPSKTINYPHEKVGIYCASHKLEGMVDLTRKKCVNENCNTRPTYNYPHEKKALYCNSHKLEGMVNVKDKTCKTPLCDIQVKDKYRGYCLRCFMYTFRSF